MLRLRVVRVPPDFHSKVHAVSRIRVVRVRDVDVIRSFAFEQIRMESHPEEAILRKRLMHLVNRDGHDFRSVRWIHTRDALAHPFGDPQKSVGTPRDFPRAGKIGRHDSRDERLWSEGSNDSRVLCGNACLCAEHQRCRRKQRDNDQRTGN